MKLYRYIAIAAAVIAVSVSCGKTLNEVKPESGSLTATQNQETNEAVPSRAAASFNGLFNALGNPNYCGYDKPDDWGILMMLYCNDLESADAFMPNSGYNWFSVCGEYDSRSSNYRNPTIRYKVPYNLIANVNDFLAGFGENVNEDQANMIAQAKALRAYAYLLLAPSFQFNYINHKDDPCVPICSPDVADPAQNPRATVKEIYDLIIADLNDAVDGLAGYDRPGKMYIDANVAHGLRARAYLDMGEWEKALADAEAAASGYTPATRAEVSVPSFMDVNEHNWIWGYDNDAARQKTGGGNTMYACSSSWLRSFSAWSYSAACQVYTCINSMLYDKISDTDVRKGWWTNADNYSPLLDGLTWNAGDAGTATGQEIVEFEYDDKLAFLPYTNVKFGCNPIGTTDNAEDSPLMRVEEMILIQAECQSRLGKSAEATKILEDFVKGYRDPSYSASASGRNFIDEVWFQRRVELWGEGFGIFDVKRLNKPMVRFKGDAKSTNQPDAFRFNMAADDGWLLMRFVDGELNTNFAIVDNRDGFLPKMDQNPDLRDGVTD